MDTVKRHYIEGDEEVFFYLMNLFGIHLCDTNKTLLRNQS